MNWTEFCHCSCWKPHWNPTWIWASVRIYFETLFYCGSLGDATQWEMSRHWQNNTYRRPLTLSYAPSYKLTQTGQTCLIYISHMGHNLTVFARQWKQLALTFVFASAFQIWQVASLRLKMQRPYVFVLPFPTLLLLSRWPATFKIYQCAHLSHICSTVCVISRRMQAEKHMVAMRRAVAWWNSSFTLSFWVHNMHWNVAHACKLSAPTRSSCISC